MARELVGLRCAALGFIGGFCCCNMDPRLLTARSCSVPLNDGSPILSLDATAPGLRASPRLARIRDASILRAQERAIVRMPIGCSPQPYGGLPSVSWPPYHDTIVLVTMAWPYELPVRDWCDPMVRDLVVAATRLSTGKRNVKTTKIVNIIRADLFEKNIIICQEHRR